MPYPERMERLKKEAELTRHTAEALPPDAKELSLGVFRRHEGMLCLGANQVRTTMREVARKVYETPDSLLIASGTRGNMWLTPEYIPLLRSGVSLMEPDGIGYMPRPINTPPFPRSVEIQQEYVDPPLTVSFSIFFVAANAPSSLAISDEEVVNFLLAYSGAMVGLGSQRGVDNNGRFLVTKKVWTELSPMLVPPKMSRFRRTKKSTLKTKEEEDKE